MEGGVGVTLLRTRVARCRSAVLSRDGHGAATAPRYQHTIIFSSSIAVLASALAYGSEPSLLQGWRGVRDAAPQQRAAHIQLFRAQEPRWCPRASLPLLLWGCSGVRQRAQQRWPGRASSWVAGAGCQPGQMRAEAGEGMWSRRFAAPAPFSMGRCVAFPSQPVAERVWEPGLERALPRLLVRP